MNPAFGIAQAQAHLGVLAPLDDRWRMLEAAGEGGSKKAEKERAFQKEVKASEIKVHTYI
jgi:hypothetical protein